MPITTVCIIQDFDIKTVQRSATEAFSTKMVAPDVERFAATVFWSAFGLSSYCLV